MTTPTLRRVATTEIMTVAHANEFIEIIDSLGRRWDPALHPRDSKGRFIRTFSFVTFKLPDGSTASGRVAGIDRDGSLLVKVEGVTPNGDQSLAGSYIQVPHDQVEVRTIKARLGAKASGILQGQQERSVVKSVNKLREAGLDAQADKLEEARRLAMSDAKDPAAAANKQQAIDLFREVAEEVGDERGKGFEEGDDLNELKANLSQAEITRLGVLDDAIKTSYTARHALGDKTIDDIETSQGTMKGNQPEVRLQAATSELEKAEADNVPVWDIRGGTMVPGQLQKSQKAQVRDTVAEPQTEGLPETWQSAYPKLRSGMDRLTGIGQATQVAPGDRHHVDKNGDEIRVGHIAHVDAATKGAAQRPEYDGMVTRIYTDAKLKKHIYVRDFDPDGSKGYQAKYGKSHHDWPVDSEVMELASDDQQSSLFQKLALEGQDKASKSLVKSFTDEYIAEMQRRYATPGALKISGTQSFFDVVPVHLRQKPDSTGLEKISIGDAVRGPNGYDGYVSYLEPNSNNARVYWHNGQSSRLASTMLTRWHGPTAEVYPGDSAIATNNYVPTRDEAADIADEMGAGSVAEVIRSNGDARAIQAAMTTDPAFQGELDDIDALYQKRDQTRAAGQDLDAADVDQLGKWDRMFMASAGHFREPDATPPPPPEAPVAEDDELPGSAGNPDEKITPEGVTIREDGPNVIVDDNVEDPIPADDQAAIDAAVQEAAQEKGTADEETSEEPAGPQPLALKLQSDLQRLVDEAKTGPLVDGNQRNQLDQMMTRLNDAVTKQDADAVVRALQGMTRVVNNRAQGNLASTRLAAVLNGRATGNVRMADFVQQKIDAGEDIFSIPEPVARPDRPGESDGETPEGVDPKVDEIDNAVSEALTMDDGSTLVMQGDDIVDDGFYVIDPSTVQEFPTEPTTKDIADYLWETQYSDNEGLSIWHDDATGTYRMARVGIFDTEQDAADAAEVVDSNQYVNIADGAVMNLALGGDPGTPAEAVEDPRSEERTVRTAGAGRSSAPRTTSKQKAMLDHVSSVEGADPEISRIAEAVKNGEEITGADASRMADHIDGLGADQFAKPSDKGVASQLAHRLARAAGEEGARGYSSQNTALRRTSDVGIGLSAQSQDDEVRDLVDAARAAVKSGDNAGAAQNFRDAADAFDALGLGNDATSRRAREHADRLDAMGGVTGPAPEQAPEVEAPEAETPETEAPGQQPAAGVTAREALDTAGLPEVEPLTQSQFSNPDTPRTRQVTPEEYTALALEGKDRLLALKEDPQEPVALEGQTWDEIKTAAWDAVQEEWGGITADAHTGQLVTDATGDQYGITMRPSGHETVSVPIGSSQEDFDAAMEEAKARWGGDDDSTFWMQQAHIGVFRNDDTGNYEIDPTLVVDSMDDVEAIGAYAGSDGGAYNFKDGLGYWPPYVAEEEAGGRAGEEGVPGPRGLEVPGEPGGEAEPGVGHAEGPQEEGGPPGGPEAPEVAEVTSALGSVESAIESENEVEGPNGPRGWNDITDEANAQLGLIRGRVTDEGPYTELSEDLNRLADYIESNFEGDTAGVVEELRETASNLTFVEAAPQGETPGEAGGDAPFRLDPADPAAIRDLVVTPEFADKRQQALADYYEAVGQIGDTVSKDVEINSVVGQMLNNRLLDAETKYSDESRIWSAIRRRGEDLSPEQVTTLLNGYNDQTVEDVLGLWSNFEGEVDPDLASGDINQILGEQVVSTAADAQAAVDKLAASDWLDTPLARAGSIMSTTSNLERAMRPDHMIEDPDEFITMVPEVAATAEHTMSLRDPEVRKAMSDTDVMWATQSARRLTDDIGSAKLLFDQLRNAGVDPAPLEEVLRTQLDKYELGDLLSMDAYPPKEIRQQGDQALMEFRQVQDTGKPAEKESIAVVDQVAIGMANSTSAHGHGTYASIVDQVAEYQRGHGGVSPALADAIRAASASDRYGFLTKTLTDLELDEAVREGNAEAVSDLTGGRKTMVAWDPEATTLSPDLTVDDRAGAEDHNAATGDRKFAEGLSLVSPNVAAALNSMYAAYGGGIHRTRANVTEASTADAERWKANPEGWRNIEGSDTRTAAEVTGVYSWLSNNIVVSDTTFTHDGYTNTVTHELGHALDGMLSGATGTGDVWFSQNDPEFLDMRNKLLEVASFGDDPNDSLMNWYFRNKSEGSKDHNNNSGTTETWAEGYAAYAAMREAMKTIDPGFPNQEEYRSYVYEEGGLALLDGGTVRARLSKMTNREKREKQGEAGKMIFEFFDDLENRRLPELMKNPVVVTKRMPNPNRVTEALGAPPPKSEQHIPNAVQVTRASTHRYNRKPIEMVELEKDAQNYDAVLDAMRAKNPHLKALPEDTIGVYYHRDWESVPDGTLLLKIIRAGKDEPTNVYDYMHEKKSNAQKFQREKAVHKVHKALRDKALTEAMDDPVAAMVATMVDSGMRVDDAKGKNRTKSIVRKRIEPVYGASSLMPKHLTFNENSVRIDFMGKSGVDNRYTVKDPRLVAALKKWSEGKGPDEFIFGDTSADQSITYLRDATGIADIINHDLRTYMANAVVFQWLEKLPAFKRPKGKNKREIAKALKDDPNPARPRKGMTQEEFDEFKVKGWKQAGAQLNDGWTTVRENYVSPYVWYSLEHELGLDHSWDELINFTGVPEHPGPTNVPAPPTNVPEEGGPRPIAAAAASEDDELAEVSSAEPSTPVEFDAAAYQALDEFYGSVEWPVDPAAPPPAPMFTESLPEGDEVE